MIDQALFWQALQDSLWISVAIQVGFFIMAALRKTDALTDLSYGLSFVAIVWLIGIEKAPLGPLAAVLVSMVTLWGVRLAAYLFIRVLIIKRDKRFDGVRENPVKFGLFWLLQAISIWVILLPASAAISSNQTATIALWQWVAIVGWVVGLAVETVADWQKFLFKLKPENKGKWISTGLWGVSRHPNYFGELLCWWSIFTLVAPELTGWSWLAVLGPLHISILILFVSGIPSLEKHYAKVYANDLAFQKYQRQTSLLIPWFKRS